MSEQIADLFQEGIRHPELRRLYDYWKARRGGRRYPGRLDIDPVDIKYALGNVSLVEVVGDPPRFRWRLVGSQLAHRLGNDMTNQWVDEYPNQGYREYLIGSYHKILKTGEPTLALNERDIEGKPRRFEVLRLPLAEDGQTINMILICPMYFEALPPRSPLGGSNPDGGPPRIIQDA